MSFAFECALYGEFHNSHVFQVSKSPFTYLTEDLLYARYLDRNATRLYMRISHSLMGEKSYSYDPFNGTILMELYCDSGDEIDAYIKIDTDVQAKVAKVTGVACRNGDTVGGAELLSSLNDPTYPFNAFMSDIAQFYDADWSVVIADDAIDLEESLLEQVRKEELQYSNGLWGEWGEDIEAVRFATFMSATFKGWQPRMMYRRGNQLVADMKQI